MRSVEGAADRSLVAVDRPTLTPAAGGVLVDVAYCGICGSDLHFRVVPELFPAGTVPGHELSGRIAEEMFQALTAPGNMRVKVLLEPGIRRERGASSREDSDGHQRRAG